MLNELDDLFRQQLDGHATPPGPGLQQRLAELAEAERLDTLFRTGLGSHASQPRRALWERLEDEHLHPQPRRRRVAGWSQYSAVAVLLLLLLVGGARLWYGRYLGPLAGPVAATKPAGAQPQRPPASATTTRETPSTSTLATASLPSQTTAKESVAGSSPASFKQKQQIFSAQATPAGLSPSSPPIAATTRLRRAATALRVASSSHSTTRRPDAAADQLATTGGRKTPAGQLPTTSQQAPATSGTPAPHENAAGAVAAFTAATAPAGVIEVEVRRGPELAHPAPPVAVAETAPSRRPRLRLGGLLRQADHLVHGEPVSLAEATGLPETLTVHARLGGRTLSKAIDL